MLLLVSGVGYHFLLSSGRLNKKIWERRNPVLDERSLFFHVLGIDA